MANSNTIRNITAIAVVAALLLSLFALNSPRANGIITESKYTSAKNDSGTIGAPEVAEAILHEANIDFSDYSDEAFVYSAKKNTVTIYYYHQDYSKEENYHFVNIDTGDVPAKEFVEDFFTHDAFAKGYGTVLEWEYEKDSRTKYTAYLTLDDNVDDTIEDYEKMRERELFTDTGLFVAKLGQAMPIPVYDSFFVLDSRTRMVGWFYFKTTYNDEDFVACFEVSGWDYDTTYEELLKGNGIYVEEVTSKRILVANSD